MLVSTHSLPLHVPTHSIPLHVPTYSIPLHVPTHSVPLHVHTHSIPRTNPLVVLIEKCGFRSLYSIHSSLKIKLVLIQTCTMYKVGYHKGIVPTFENEHKVLFTS